MNFPTLVIAMALQAVPVPQGRNVTEGYRAAMHAYDECLRAAAQRLRSREAEPVRRYGRYARACGVERSAMIDAFMRANPSDAPGARAERYGWAVRRADDRAQIWAGRFLDPPPIAY